MRMLQNSVLNPNVHFDARGAGMLKDIAQRLLKSHETRCADIQRT